jgi:hypothetical protein
LVNCRADSIIRLGLICQFLQYICPIGVELAPVKAMLDERHLSLPTSRDINSYTLGRIGEHNVVIVVMLEIGNNRHQFIT